jgi:hypothetical protein
MFDFFSKFIVNLKDEFPFKMDFKNEFSGFLKSSIILIILLYVVGFFNPDQNVFYYFSGFFFTLLLTFLFNYFLNLIVISKLISSEKWCLWKEILRRLFFLAVYSFTIILYIDYSLNINFSKVDFWQFVTTCFIIGSIPIIIKIFITKNRFLKASLAETELLQEKISLHQSEIKKLKEEIVIKSNIINEVFKIDVNDLLYLKSDQNYISIYYLKEGELKNHLLRISLVNALKQITAESIFRCHRSYAVNINCIEKITGNAQSLKLALKQDCIVPVSRSFIKEFKTKLVN